MLKRLFLALLLGIMPTAFSLSLQAAEMAVASQSQAVNINSADAKTLAQNLNGVGKSRAEEIVRYREAYGPFYSVDDLLEVRGVGKSIVDNNRDRIILE
ncbi:MAG: ComEA family DNA-binding protein [Gammaproteobacteria bacterium]|nr:ComEA family DNA-binding protein [Gammaproteobacteria bacterium]